METLFYTTKTFAVLEVHNTCTRAVGMFCIINLYDSN